MDTITRKAYAKINLNLDVLRRREDGYHEVKMIMQTIDLSDELTFTKLPANTDSKEPAITLSVERLPENADIGPVEKNLIYRAAKLIMEEYKVQDGVSIVLNKSIPVAAGMAGGSTDAAAVFHGLNELFSLGMSVERMCELGVKLGADIPYCIKGGTCLSEGIGEKLTSIATPPESVLLIAKPDIAVSTKFVYENLHANDLPKEAHPDVDAMIEALEDKDILKMSKLLGNVLERVTVPAYPIIDEIKTMMNENGALGSLMSGSGPTVFGLFGNDIDSARKTAKMIEEAGLSKEVFVTKFI